jgi:uncharacterized protein YciI
MVRFVVAIVLLAVGCAPLSPGRDHVAERPGEPSMQTFLVLYRPGPSWDPARSVREQNLGAHGQYLLGLYAKGTMTMAGPFTDDAGGGVVLSVATAREATAVAAYDPAVVSGVFEYEVHPWDLVPWVDHLPK